MLKYGIFIMHEMPAGAQLIRVLEWEQVGMWQKKRKKRKIKTQDYLSETDLQNRWKYKYLDH